MFVLKRQRLVAVCGFRPFARPPAFLLPTSGALLRSLHTYFRFGHDYDPELPSFALDSLADRPETLGKHCTEVAERLLQSSKADPLPLIQNHLENITSQVHKIVSAI